MLGRNQNIIRPIEQAVAGMMGVSTHNLGMFTHFLKSVTYMAQLTANVVYALTTPLQALVTLPAWHQVLSGQGFGNKASAFTAMHDFFIMGQQHWTSEFAGKELSAGGKLSSLGEVAKTYMQDNGLMATSLFDENASLEHSRVEKVAKRVTNVSVGLPESFSRIGTFLSLVHHLDSSGAFPKTQEGQLQMFRKAEEITNNALIDFKRSERPPVVGYLGQIGNAAYTYKSFLFSIYNQMSAFTRLAAQGNPKPLLSALGMMMVMGGLTNLPGVNEMDGLLSILKNRVAAWMPEHYANFRELSIRGLAIQNIEHLTPSQTVNDMLLKGVPSAALGVDLQSKFSPQAFDPTRPVSSLFPVGQELLEQEKTVKFIKELATGGNVGQALAEAIWVNSPDLAKKWEEALIPYFTIKKVGDLSYAANPNDLASQRVHTVLNQDDRDKRALGFRSLNVANQREKDALVREDATNLSKAQEGVIKGVFNFIQQGKQADAESRIKYFFNQLDGSEEKFNSGISRAIEDANLTPDQAAAARVKALDTAKSYLYRRSLTR
jgi:hypothetical protein